MTVIHYIGSFGFGGIGRLVYDLIYQQNQRKNLETAVGVGNLSGEFKSQFEKLDSELIGFNLNSGYDFNPFKILKISKHFKSFDVIHLHGFHLSIALAALWSKKIIIYTEHGNFGFGRPIKASDKISFFLRKLFFKYSKASICCNSNFTKNYVATNFYKGERLKLVYNGSNLINPINENLRYDLQKKYQEKFVIGTSSRLAGFKRIDRLISVFSRFQKHNPSAILLIVGEGIERKNLENQVLELNIKDKVVFEGFQNEVATYQSIFDVCVFPSLSEPFGLVAVEGYSKNKPVLVFKDGGGITEIVSSLEQSDVCDNEEKMLERLDFYKKNEFRFDSDFKNQLEFFSLKRMEEDYCKQYMGLE